MLIFDFEYGWRKDFQPPFEPFAAGASVMRDYQRNLTARTAMFNRYKNSAAWVDSLLGRFFAALRESGRLLDDLPRLIERLPFLRFR